MPLQTPPPPLLPLKILEEDRVNSIEEVISSWNNVLYHASSLVTYR